MAKSISGKISDSKKWLKKNAEAGLNLKSAQTALLGAEKAIDELGKLRGRIAELTETRKTSLLALSEAIAKAKMEKRLKAKETKLQSKLAALAAPPAK